MSWEKLGNISFGDRYTLNFYDYNLYKYYLNLLPQLSSPVLLLFYISVVTTYMKLK
ncbi:hypothetical protein WJM97_08310 [Okeanomitos corallinicola TIOX110]|uniref:Uncharacterized protein n=1 Tax=Okeanomitos corallinicola TIOX110 TaxID=3133117 RepID=A0ABZ2UXL4_9CYAN